MRTWIVCTVVLLGIGPAGAETLYNQDGVRLSATVEAIDPGAAVCRVREQRHSEAEYARLHNHQYHPTCHQPSMVTRWNRCIRFRSLPHFSMDIEDTRAPPRFRPTTNQSATRS